MFKQFYDDRLPGADAVRGEGGEPGAQQQQGRLQLPLRLPPCPHQQDQARQVHLPQLQPPPLQHPQPPLPHPLPAPSPAPRRLRPPRPRTAQEQIEGGRAEVEVVAGAPAGKEGAGGERGAVPALGAGAGAADRADPADEDRDEREVPGDHGAEGGHGLPGQEPLPPGRQVRQGHARPPPPRPPPQGRSHPHAHEGLRQEEDQDQHAAAPQRGSLGHPEHQQQHPQHQRLRLPRRAVPPAGPGQRGREGEADEGHDQEQVLRERAGGAEAAGGLGGLQQQLGHGLLQERGRDIHQEAEEEQALAPQVRAPLPDQHLPPRLQRHLHTPHQPQEVQGGLQHHRLRLRPSRLLIHTKVDLYESELGIAVHEFDIGRVLLGCFLAPELEGGGQHAVLDTEVFLHEVKLLHVLRPRNGLGVGCLQPLQDHLPEGLVPLRLLHCLHAAPLAGQELLGGFLEGAAHGRVLLEADQAGQVLPMVADGHHVGQAGQGVLYLVFDQDGRDVLSPRSDDEFLDSPRDEQHPVLGESSQVPRVEEALRVDGLGGVLCVLEVAHAHVPAPHADFALLVLFVELVDLQLSPVDLGAHLQIVFHVLEAQLVGVGGALGSRALGHPVAVPEVDVEGEEVLANDGVQGGRPKDKEPALVKPQGLLDVIVNQLFGQLELQTRGLSSRFLHRALLPYALRPSTCVATQLPILASMPVLLLAISIIFEYIFSHTLGTEKKPSGFTSSRVWRRVPCKAEGSAKQTWLPVRRERMISMNWPAAWDRGRQLMMRTERLASGSTSRLDLQLHMKLSWESMTPLGIPVVPLVQMRVQQLPGLILPMASSRALSSTPLPVAMKSLNFIILSLNLPSISSPQIIILSMSPFPSKSQYFCATSRLSATTMRAQEWVAMYSQADWLLVEQTPTGMHLARMEPIQAMLHSGALNPMRLTTEKSEQPAARRALANLTQSQQYSLYVMVTYIGGEIPICCSA